MAQHDRERDPPPQRERREDRARTTLHEPRQRLGNEQAEARDTGDDRRRTTAPVGGRRPCQRADGRVRADRAERREGARPTQQHEREARAEEHQRALGIGHGEVHADHADRVHHHRPSARVIAAIEVGDERAAENGGDHDEYAHPVNIGQTGVRLQQ